MIKSFYEQPKFDQASDLKLEDFLAEGGQNNLNAMSESEQLSLITEALKDHTKIFYALKQRNENLEGLLKFWQKKDLIGTLSALYAIKDPNFFVDALSCTFGENPKPLELFTFDQADHLLKKCVDILSSDKFQAHLQVALTVLRHLLDLFRGMNKKT